MNQTRNCGCKGWRSCLLCEREFKIQPPPVVTCEEKKKGYVFCHDCRKAWPGWSSQVIDDHPHHSGDSIHFPGVYVCTNFLSEDEKEKLINGINSEKWDSSQSGRRKQNYGPKCNFKKNKIQLGSFCGFPYFSKFVQDKFSDLNILNDYHVIEQCSLEYDPLRGASIDPHIDDCWIWGERIVTVNVLGDTYLTMTKYTGDKKKYNLDQVQTYPPTLDCDGNLLNQQAKQSNSPFYTLDNCKESDIIVRVFMPEKSLVILFGSARYLWEHSVLREDIMNYRICLAYREFTPPYLPGGEYDSIGKEILIQSKNFW